MTAAIEVFSEHGYHRASMDEIALRACVAKGTLYYNFPNKAQLFKTLVKQGLQEIMDTTCQALDMPLTLEESIQRVIRLNLDMFLESTNFAHIIFNELSNGIEQEVLLEIKELRREYLHFLADILEESKCGGYVRDVNCMIAATSIVGMLQSSCNYYLNNKNEMSREDLEYFLFTLITKGLFTTHA
ncbi:TetR/AcrR family transcriptional regulator [Paenibacillus selenitireducens]|uniref:TetR/AcrR family transcriptional regulator n=1 Tax=Paenibacillus selenitireducens TaxID=1324314 RepID=UPI0022B90761|nr:TetR/AcrR family transcriptional regulator [Paenibacillus selenitireducens]